MSFLLRSHSVGIAAIALGISVFLSRILGLVRDKVISYYFGTGMESDVYFTAFVVPDFLSHLLAGGYFSITLVPLLSRSFLEDERDAWRFFSAAVCWAFVLIFLFCCVAWVFAPELAVLVAPGYSAEKTTLLARYLRIILPAQIFFLPGACFTALLYCRKQFSVPALSPLVYNSGIILGGFAGIYWFPGSGMEGFCWGVLAGALVGSLLLPVWAARQGGVRFSPGLRHPRMKTLLLLALPLILGQSIVSVDEQFVRIFGSLAGEGSVSLLSYARRIMMVPVGVIAQAAGLASFPFLAALAAQNNTVALDEHLGNTLKNALLIAIPVSLWVISAAEPVMRLIFQQGSFSSEAARESGVLLAVMMAGVAFWTVQQIIGRAYYAFQDTVTPAVLGFVATALSVGVYYYGAVTVGPAGVAAAGTFGVGVYTMLLCAVWIKRHGAAAFTRVPALMGYSVVFALPAMAAAYYCGEYASRFLPFQSLGGAFVFLAASGSAFAVVYLALGRFCKPEVLMPLERLLRRFMRSKTSG